MTVIPTSLLFVELLIFFVVSFSSIISIVPDSCPIINDEKISDPAICQYPNDLITRLSKQILPRKYVIAVAPDLQNNIFHGAIEITCELLQAQSHVALHSKNLKVESTCICNAMQHRFHHPCLLEAVYPVPEYEMIVIKFTKILQPGIYTIRMNFSGRMDDGMNGFYLSTYTSSADCGAKRKLAVTQFEPTYARKAFPCFDEPAFKSIFDVKIIHPISNGYHAMSNMPALSVEKLSDRSDLAITCFASTLPMSTYSLAFLVSDFTCIASTVASLTGTSITVSVCSSLANKHKVRFALDVATKTLDFYMKFFQIDYPLPKLDLVSVPDFAAGAMENWGLVTFRETEIVRSDEHSSVGNTKSVALTIAHELAHMWFGNLVTFEWWDDLWLNEGFATYMEYVAVEHIFPQWKQMECFALETKYLTMRSDAKISANPIIRRAENADEIGQMFDHISYQKGAAVIKMLEDVMGTAKFIGGIREYFLAYKFGNAATRQLLEILQKHFGSEVNLIEFMKTWTESPGFPVLNICRNSATKYKIFQKRFLSHRSAVENSTWDLPIRYVTSRTEDGVQLVWFSGNATCAELSLENQVDWIKLNHGSIGYYIVNYGEDLWCTFVELLTRDINVVNPLDRADLLHDAFVLADSGNAVYDVALNLTTYLVNESAFQPWVVAASWILRVDRLLAGRPVRRGFRCYARRLIENAYRKVDWNVNETENFVSRELRFLVLRLACSIGHKDCLRVGEEKLRMFIESNGTVRPPADLRSIIYSFGLVPLGPEHLVSYEKMWEIFIREYDPQEKERLLIGLADIREPAMIMRYLDRVADENLVKRQDFFTAIGKVASNPPGLDIIWNFVRNNWVSLVKKYSLNDAAMGSFVAKIVASFKETRSLNEAKKFFHKYPEAGAGANSRSLALEESASNVKWLSRNPEAIERWLKINGFWRKRERRCI